MKVFVGTSGWSYSWNKGGSLDWYVKESGFNAVELNMSFYRLPFESMIRSWSVKGERLRWVIKVNRMITHVYKFGSESREFWERFASVFKPLNSLIDYYLFQLPPSTSPASLELIEEFFKQTGVIDRIALEARNVEWFSERYLDWAERIGVVFVSVDSPKLPLNVYKVKGVVYLRMHGRSAWYKHYYSEEELRGVACRILDLKPLKVYVFFNNDQGMFENGRRMMQLLRELY